MNTSLERLRARRERLEDKEGGFTLIELLIVIVILAILAAIVVFAVQNLSGTSAQASCTSDFKTVQTGVEAYKAQMGNYPDGAGTQSATSVSSSTNTDADPIGGTNAAAANAELLTGSENGATAGAPPFNDFQSPAVVTKNLISPSGSAAQNAVGPWLKTAPVNGNHYAIFVSNDGKGIVTVDSVTAGAASGTAIPAVGGNPVGVCADVS